MPLVPSEFPLIFLFCQCVHQVKSCCMSHTYTYMKIYWTRENIDHSRTFITFILSIFKMPSKMATHTATERTSTQTVNWDHQPQSCEVTVFQIVLQCRLPPFSVFSRATPQKETHIPRPKTSDLHLDIWESNHIGRCQNVRWTLLNKNHFKLLWGSRLSTLTTLKISWSTN